jgi:hypothetical protein
MPPVAALIHIEFINHNAYQGVVFRSSVSDAKRNQTALGFAVIDGDWLDE